MTKLIFSDKRSRRTDQYLISVSEAFKLGEINLLRTIYRDIELIEFGHYKYYLARCKDKLPDKEDPKCYLLNIQGTQRTTRVKDLIEQIETLKKLIGAEV